MYANSIALEPHASGPLRQSVSTIHYRRWYHHLFRLFDAVPTIELDLAIDDDDQKKDWGFVRFCHRHIVCRIPSGIWPSRRLTKIRACITSILHLYYSVIEYGSGDATFVLAQLTFAT